MPVVGERYKLGSKNIIVRVLPIVTVIEEATGSVKEYGVEIFNSIYEEIPNNSQKPSEVQVKESMLSDEVREAMEELDKELLAGEITEKMDFKFYILKLYNNLSEKAQNLLNALESMDKSNIPEKTKEKLTCSNCGKVCVNPISFSTGSFYNDYCSMDCASSQAILTSDKSEKGDCGIVEDADIASKIRKLYCDATGLSEKTLFGKAEEDCELEQAADEWNTESIEEEKKSEEEKLSRELFKCTFGFDKETEEEKPKSIWRDVSELPDRSCNIFIKWIDGDILPAEFFSRRKVFKLSNNEEELEINDSRIKGFVLLTDLINDYESEKQKRIELEQRINKLESLN